MTEPSTNGSHGSAATFVGTAVAAMLLGGLGGAMKAMHDRQTDEPPADATDESTADAPDEPAERDEGAAEEDEPAEPQAREDDGDAGADRTSPADDESESESGPERTGRVQGVSGGDASAILTEARRQLATLLGSEPERVSGLERVDGAWSVELEVVELARIPTSTDVLATYELTLDDDARLVSAHRIRRYRRSQIDDL